MNLEDIDIKELLPLFMRAGEDNCALADGLSEVLQPLAQQVKRLSTWDQLGMLGNAELDALAAELNIFWYNSDYSLEQKRATILNSDKIYMKLGTVGAVADVVNDIFGGARVEEWFNYGGQPHYFRIIVDNPSSMSKENEAKFLQILERVKRKSQWLEKVVNEILAGIPMYIGATVAVHKSLSVRVDVWQEHTPDIGINAGLAFSTRQAGSESPKISIK